MKIFKGNYGYSFLAKGKEDEKGTFVSVQFPKEENYALLHYLISMIHGIS